MKVFIHIPKTAGTTMIDILSRQIYFKKFRRVNPTRNTHPKEFLSKVEGLLDKELLAQENFEIIGGHFGFKAHPELSNPEDHFTILRDPVERVISEYYFMKYKGMYYQDLIEGENLSLLDYLHHPETTYLNNLQTRLISGEKYETGELVTQEMYEKALSHLEAFKAIGITENMKDSIALFYQKFGWKRIPYYLTSNSNEQKTHRTEIPESTIKAIEEREKFDIQLYQQALEIFQKEVDKQQSKLKIIKKQMGNQGITYKIYLKILSKIMHSRLV
ncbi:sulfotransferase family 2 domain-containing protein [Flexithrix dorotheae]|uniref:sulfotransferase family 2 domain-containing protein n=1 Tax=Flexithrix dorotheae TaxID=70993 RepID=UPI0003755E69|nr:sulfotransferase family 2 domain-containing protein [Flexithrix dorotheae]